jgi:ATP-dependent DNA helicase RecQ
MSLDEVCTLISRARSTTIGYLVEFIEQQAMCDATHWLAVDTIERIAKAVDKHGRERLKPIFDELGGEVPYDDIRIALACLQNSAPTEGSQERTFSDAT